MQANSTKDTVFTPSQEQAELRAFFEQFAEPDLPPLPDDEIFICNMTFREFFNLSEEEQAFIWQEAHIKKVGK